MPLIRYFEAFVDFYESNIKVHASFLTSPDLMHLRKLSLVNFKNYSEAELSFEPGANAFVGGNGEGKTNLLDAIHYLSMSKSYLHAIDAYNILHGEDFFMIQGVFDQDGREDTIYCGLKRNQKKVFKINQKEYDRLADHIGLLPVVMISPSDSNLISEGSEERRKFLDSIISQYDKVYLDQLLQYNRVVSQRNSYLRQSSQSGSFEVDSLSVWDVQLVHLGEKIHQVITSYDDLHRPVIRKSSGFYTRITNYTYDEKGNLTEESLSDENGMVITRSLHDYDENNRLVADAYYETDLTRGGRDTSLGSRYEYEFYA